MYSKMVYYADDGTIFENENDCLNYENKGRFVRCIFLDENQKRIPLQDSTVEDIMFMHFPTVEELKDFIAACDDYGYDTPMLTPVKDIQAPYDFYWDDDERCFIHYGERIRTLHETANDLAEERTMLFYNND